MIATASELVSSKWAAPIVAAGRQFAAANVAAVFLVHGTFAGSDNFGLVTDLARIAPTLSNAIGSFRKRLFDFVARETGNYTNAYANRLQQCLSAGAGREIPVRNWLWSGLNNHIGRADGAIRLLLDLGRFATDCDCQQALPPRIQLWGHSHGGNVIAIAGSLLAADRSERDQFFTAARRYYRRWQTGAIDVPAWEHVRELLAKTDHPVRRFKLDAVTFGMPIRYAWHCSASSTGDGVDKLLHFVNHRPTSDRAEFLAPANLRIRRVLTAADGDNIARVGIAGSNFPPIPLSLRSFLADRAIGRLLEGDLERESILTRVSRGRRVSDCGTTLLVDYRDAGLNVARHILGHAVYTRSRWLPFHCATIAEEFYGAVGRDAERCVVRRTDARMIDLVPPPPDGV